ncbi:putative reverse transcriptase [Gregarina niphandrodes]|uniref:Reverse transcriptase n=1 Tax=Gregarina niphandrodes TaxID=110365 RepID=A0A023AX07_GRENI|nr:putative reverse transcriptase [Gregarina niphandrodes]EZG42765.1 putative reverse transcriptase [Gregarina niphandrodes]|eukprot:XP_011133955.1 putative reverse transcriptase [Gregarina niphandrodes]
MQAIGPVIAWAAGQREIMKIDLSKAFHAIPIADDQKNYYSFMGTDGATYRYVRMPMGAPKHFATVMMKVLGELPDMDKTHVRSYQDDIIVAGTTRRECADRYHRVIRHLCDYGFKINREKSSMNTTLTILGYEFTKGSIGIPKAKAEQIRKLLRSECIDGITRATHQLSYYKMIHKTGVRNSLTKIRQILLKTKHVTNVVKDLIDAVDSEWTIERTKPIQGNTITVYVDASDTQAGMVVKYNDQIVMTESIPLTKTSTNLASYKEIQGAYKLLAKYKSAIDFIDRGAEKIIVTDNMRLWQALERQGEPRNDLEVYAARIQALYKASYQHIPGGQNPADEFSRRHRLPT